MKRYAIALALLLFVHSTKPNYSMSWIWPIAQITSGSLIGMGALTFLLIKIPREDIKTKTLLIMAHSIACITTMREGWHNLPSPS